MFSIDTELIFRYLFVFLTVIFTQKQKLLDRKFVWIVGFLQKFFSLFLRAKQKV